jgi:hypothetical protein
MNWRNPKEVLPEQGQLVWVMLEPHKDRGSLLESAPSIEIVCGWAFRYDDVCGVDNNDELGLGGISWYLTKSKNKYLNFEAGAMAWMPVEEMPLPGWVK